MGIYPATSPELNYFDGLEKGRSESIAEIERLRTERDAYKAALEEETGNSLSYDHDKKQIR